MERRRLGGWSAGGLAGGFNRAATGPVADQPAGRRRADHTPTNSLANMPGV